jgi:hypothetical protein
MSTRVQWIRDPDVRPRLREWIAQQPGGKQAVLCEEFGLCNGESRADMAVLTPRLTGFEIKSPGDRLDRLARQAGYYDQVFEHSWLVTTDHYLHQAAAHVSQWWGLLLLDLAGGQPTLRVVRAAQPNPVQQPLALARLLWREEVLAELAALGQRTGTSRLPRHRRWQMLADALPTDRLSQRVQHAVAARLLATVTTAPPSASDAAYALPGSTAREDLATPGLPRSRQDNAPPH